MENGFDKNKLMGWRLVYKSAFDNPVTGAQKPYTKFEAWMWLLCEAAHEPYQKLVDFGGKERLINVERGQIAHSIRFIARAWGWKKTRTANFLNALKTAQMLGQQTGQQISILTICNFEIYQDPFSRKSGQQNGQQADSKRTASPKNRDKHEDNNKINTHTLNAHAPAPGLPVGVNAYGEWENVFLTEQEHEALVLRLGAKKAEWCINELSGHMASKGDNYDKHFPTLLRWPSKKYDEQKQKETERNEQSNKKSTGKDTTATRNPNDYSFQKRAANGED